MAFSVPLTDDDRALINERYAQLRQSGVGAEKAQAQVAEEVGRSTRTIRKVVNEQPATVQQANQPPGFIKGTSTLYDDKGNVKLQWVKADNKLDEARIREWMEGLAADLPKASPVVDSKLHSDDTLTVIPMGDPHVGMFSWNAETGDDFDLDIATTDLCAAVTRLVHCTPKSKQALIVNLGDFFHADNNGGETARGHNKLDTDTRWAKVLLAGLKAMRQCIASALEHHEHVTVINAIGNHDDHSSMFLTIALSNIYENEPRLKIIADPTISHYYEFGENLIGVHHGHTIKPDQLPLLMAADRPQAWGRCKHRLWLCGHLHQDILREYQGVRVETFRTLAGRDAWAASMGYRSGRDMKAIILHKTFGEVERHTVSVEMLRKTATN